MIRDKNTKTSGFEIRTLNWLYTNRGIELQSMHLNKHMMVVFVQQGKVIHNVDQTRYEMQDEIYVVHPGCIHKLFIEDNTNGYALYIDPAVFDKSQLLGNFYTNSYASNAVQKVRSKFTEDIKAELQDLFCKLRHESEHYDMARTDIWTYYILILMSQISRLADLVLHTSSQMVQAQTVKRFIDLVDKNFRTRKRVSEYAGELKVTANHLTAMTTKIIGTPANTYIRNRIILEAKRQIMLNGLSLKENAYFLGFNDVAHFSKFFKNAVGVNYSDYLRSNLVIETGRIKSRNTAGVTVR